MTRTAITIVLTTLILAQPTRPPLLAGPKVAPQGAVEAEAVFRVTPRQRPAQLGPYRWRQLIKTLDLDRRQRSEIQGIVQEFGRVSRAFRESHGERLKALTRREREARNGGERLGVDEQHEVRELRATRPKAVDALRRIWALLDHEQRQQLRDLLTEARKDAPRTSG